MTNQNSKVKKHKTKTIKIGNVAIGGNSPVRVQSMTKTKTADVSRTVEQILKLEKLGCELIRVAVPDMKSAKVLGKIKNKIHIPLIADIHFDYKLALESLNQGVDKLRLNPGNIRDPEKIKEIAKSAKKRKVPIRVGANSGSLAPDILKKYKNKVTPEGLIESVLREIKILEKEDFTDIVVSVKTTDVLQTIEAYRLLAKKINYPLHLGVTESGFGLQGVVKSALGIGVLLSEGIGDTIRVSLTAPPEEEVKTGFEILRALGLREYGPELISCPTCGRCEVDLMELVREVQKLLRSIKRPFKAAVMGCVVNGPGEARQADIGIACGRNKGVIFKKGKVIKQVPVTNLLETFKQEIISL